MSQLVERFTQRGLAGLLIGPGRGRKESSRLEQRQRIMQELERPPDREEDQTATWSLMPLRNALRQPALPEVGVSPIREVMQEAGYRFGKTRTWCPTGTAVRVRTAGTGPVKDPKAGEKNTCSSKPASGQKRQDCRCGERHEAGPSQAIPQPGEDWHREGKSTLQPHEDVRGGTAKWLTLLRRASGDVHAKGVLSAPTAVRHPWLQEELQRELAQLHQEPLAVRVPVPEDHPRLAHLATLVLVL